ncbi:MAG: CDP-alcohol phosphatidyltransferase family protein [Prevotellaceae bacterium]|jgi:CDP-diacylglycerol--serine O-phosphatidyltransferase|nr:CDP-alcohol phosphatidyltransferase family protein [Prevotellaceae bacterium]
MHKGKKNDSTAISALDAGAEPVRPAPAIRWRLAVPNTITSLNLLCGCMAVVLALRGWSDYAVYLIAAAAVFDFCDGLSARLLHAYSELGKQLDSLADAISFGLAPAALLHYKLRFLLSDSISGSLHTIGWELLTFAPFVITIFSALRLAKFNIDKRQHAVFLGLPTPANALLIASLLSLSANGSRLTVWMDSWYGVLLLCASLSALLVCGLPMFSLKFTNLRWRDNAPRFVWAGMAVVIVAVSALLQQGFMFAVAAIIVSYILLSGLLYAIRATSPVDPSNIIPSK